MHRSDAVLRAILLAIAVLAIAVPTLVVTHPPAMPVRHAPPHLVMPRRVVPAAELPPVEPVKFVALDPEDARAFNASVPFVDGPNPAARPFRYPYGAEDLNRATDCLAAAVLYEAGDDAVGERAVAQVVLNRLRHPAFPKTVCGVVFEGSERTTGCQFTFTCDGALARHPSADGWRRAREVAAAALAGSVYKPVGYATHYHTDWVVPYWQSSLDKLAAVHTHLFFRWSGWWGTPPAFNRQVQAGEPVVAKLADLSDAHGMGTALVSADAAVTAAAPFMGRSLVPLASDPNTFLTTIDPAQPPESYFALVVQACGERPRCKVMGWSDVGAMAFNVPLTPEQIAALSFSYMRDRSVGYDKALWNCAEFKHIPTGSCMKRQLVRAVPVDGVPAPAATPTPVPSATPTPTPADRGTGDLGGVRRKAVGSPAPAAPGTGAPAAGQDDRPAAPPRVG